MRIGVLAVQGDFELHKKAVEELGTEAVYVKKPEELQKVDGLIIPGGESTTFVNLLKKGSLFEGIKEFAKNHAVFGTCAGLIVLSAKVINHPVDTLNLIDITVERNAYGRQIDSFVGEVQIQLDNSIDTIEGVFIRAPKIIQVGEGVKILGKYRDDVVLVENENILAATFHPELTDNRLIHQYFLKKIEAL